MLCDNNLSTTSSLLSCEFSFRTELGPWTLIAGDALLQADGKENENVDNENFSDNTSLI